jgi:hypothetical protein
MSHLVCPDAAVATPPASITATIARKIRVIVFLLEGGGIVVGHCPGRDRLTPKIALSTRFLQGHRWRSVVESNEKRTK